MNKYLRASSDFDIKELRPQWEFTSVIDNFLSIEDQQFSADRSDMALPGKFDAIYIPTKGKRPNIINVVKNLDDYCDNIFLLFSETIPFDFQEIKSRKLHCITDYGSDVIDPLDLKSSTPSSTYMSDYDIPLKRNFALKHARRNAFRNIGLIDDDIIFDGNDIGRAIKLLGKGYEMIGFYVSHFPDVSTIEHIECFINKLPANVSIGGNFLFFDVNQVVGFFPYIYNEDWHFIINNAFNKTKICSAGSVKQLYHEPWNNIDRIRFEQFGELIIYGVRENIIKNNNYLNSDKTFWETCLYNYLNILSNLVHSCENKDIKQRVEVAHQTCKNFTLNEIIDFIENLSDEQKLYV